MSRKECSNYSKELLVDSKPIDYQRTYQRLYKSMPNYGVHNWGVWTLPFWVNQIDWNKPVLDAGCGNGLLCNVLSVMGVNAVGVDVLTGIFDRSQFRYHRIDLSCEQIPYPDGYFGTAVTFDVLEHLTAEDATFAIAEILRVSDRQILCPCHGPGTDKSLHLTVEDSAWWLGMLQRITKQVEPESACDWRMIGLSVASPQSYGKLCDVDQERTLYIRNDK